MTTRCACLVLLYALCMATPSRAQTPAPAPRPAPAEDAPATDDAPARDDQADSTTPARPTWRRRAPAPESVPPAAGDGAPREAGRTEGDAGGQPLEGADTDGERDAGSSGMADATGAAPADATLSSEVSDAGVPSALPLDGGAPDTSVPAPAAVTMDAGAPVDAGVAPAPPPIAPPPATTTFVQVPVPFVPPSESGDPWEGLREIIPGIPTGGIGPLGLLALLALLALLSALIERLRSRLLRDGWLPTLLSFVQVSARLLGLLVALALVIQVVPANVRWVVYFILMASGAALGWSMRDVMPDLIAGVVIVFERRIRRGMWIRSDEFSGAVERIGLRSTWLRDSKGHRVAVPNRMLMQIPIVSDEEGDTVQEVVLRLSSKANAADIRRALRDAVLASPWTTPQCEPQVLRDPMDPELWQVRGRLLSASFASAFQGQLLERAEAHLLALDKREKPDKPVDKPKTPSPP